MSWGRKRVSKFNQNRKTTLSFCILPSFHLVFLAFEDVGVWPRLVKDIDDGRFYIDNNLIENSIMPVALERKNNMFVGSHEAAQLDRPVIMTTLRRYWLPRLTGYQSIHKEVHFNRLKMVKVIGLSIH
jgi:hypothetical protein